MPKTLLSASKLAVPGLGHKAAHVVPLEVAPGSGAVTVTLDPPAPGLVAEVCETTARGFCLRFAPKGALTEPVVFKSVKVAEE